MIRGIVASSMRFRLLVLALAAALMIFGYWRLPSMAVDTVPEFTPPYVEIQTEALGLSAAEVESLITVPMEQILLNGVPWLDEVRSESVPSLSSIVLVFDPGTDIMRARQMVQERLTQARDLPHVSRPPTMIQPLSSSSRVMMVRLSSDELTPIEMSVISRWTIKPRLMGIEGVANVSIFGQRERQLQVQVDPEKLREQGVTLAQVIETTANALWVSPLTFVEASTPGSGGFIDTPNQRLGIQHLLPISTAEDLARVTMKGVSEGGQTLGDVATVVEDHQPLIGDAVTEEGQDLFLVVEKFPGTNTLQVTKDIETALDDMAPGLQGIETDTSVYRPASFIETAVDNLKSALLIGAFLVVLLMACFLFDWRVAIISLIAIPLAFLAAVVVLYIRGSTMNSMVLAGLVIAIGAVIDDAIIDIENIKRRLHERRQLGQQVSTATVIVEASQEVRGTVAYATAISIIAVGPLFFLDGTTGSFYRSIAFSYILALLASMVVALTVTPALAATLLASPASARRESPIVRWLQRGYESILPRFVYKPRWAVAALAVLLVAGFAILPFLDQTNRPSFKETDLLVHWEAAPGTSLPEMNRITNQVSSELRAIPGVRNVGAHVGRAITSDQIVSVNTGEIWLSIDSSANYDETTSSIRETVEGYPGISRNVLTYSDERFDDPRIAGTSEDIVVRIYGQEYGELKTKADEVMQILAGVDGVANERIEQLSQEPQVEIQVDLDKAQQFGLKPGDVRRAAAAMLQGIEVGNLFEQQKVFDVLVVGVPEVRHSVTSVQNLMIDTPDGGQVRLGDVADVRVAPNLSSIKHDAVSRKIDVLASVNGRSASAVANEIEDKLGAVNFPLEYHAEVLGDYATDESERNRIFALSITAALLIFLLLQAAFASWRLAALVFLTLPTALVGGIVVAFLREDPVSIGALVGFLTVLGIAARNAIMLIRRYQFLQTVEQLEVGPELAMRGALDRLPAIVLTSLATAVALLPLVITGDRAGQEIIYPMAIVILGGLVTSTLLNLFVVPSFYGHVAPGPKTVTSREYGTTGGQVASSPASD
jgi:CzcA family heavy metal efflux pump